MYIRDNEKIWDVDINELLSRGMRDNEIIIPVEPVAPALRTAAEKGKRKDAS